MSAEKREKKWKRKNKDYYRKRHSEIRDSKEINIEKAKTFINSCRTSSGYTNNIKIQRPTIEGTMAGVGCENILGLKLDRSYLRDYWSIGKSQQKWKVFINSNTYLITTQKLYRLTMLYRMADFIDNNIQNKISQISLDLLNQKKEFLLTPKNFNDLRNLYEILASLQLINYFEKNRFTFEIDFTQLSIKKFIIQSKYNQAIIDLILKRRSKNEVSRGIQQVVKDKSSKDGYRATYRHHPNIWDLFCMVNLVLEFDFKEGKTEEILIYLAKCQGRNGGFRSSIHEGAETLLHTYAVLYIREIIENNFRVSHIDPLTGIVFSSEPTSQG
ncbi:MAG: prenyltransferase/squalene oxidase repeat-containing protein [Candidatus Helarchaeota archaeon]